MAVYTVLARETRAIRISRAVAAEATSWHSIIHCIGARGGCRQMRSCEVIGEWKR